MEKMRGMKGILTHDETRILNIIESACYEMETIEEKKDGLIYITAFTTAMKIVKNNLEVLPGEEFICRLNSLIDKIEKSMSIKN